MFKRCRVETYDSPVTPLIVIRYRLEKWKLRNYLLETRLRERGGDSELSLGVSLVIAHRANNTHSGFKVLPNIEACGQRGARDSTKSKSADTLCTPH